jgi:hypothetical protein
MSDMDLNKEYDRLMDEPWVRYGTRLKIKEMKALLDDLPNSSSVAIIHPDKLEHELFTNAARSTSPRRDGAMLSLKEEQTHPTAASDDLPQARQLGPEHHIINKIFGIRPRLVAYVPYVDRPEPNSCLSCDRADDDWINLETLKSWITTCNSYHGEHCYSIIESRKPSFAGPRWLIDVHRQCIVRASPVDRYVALSYVWGRTTSSCAKRANILELQEDNSLLSDGIVVPRTIQDVIALVRILGETYLWVDRFCIVQDDLETKKSQLEDMASIYGASFLTVIAAQGDDCESGLCGIPGVTNNPRRYHRVAYPAELISDNDPKCVRKVMGHNAALLTQSGWFSRAWTLQEYIFARRKVIFHHDMMNWECHCTSQHERWHLANDSNCGRPLPQTAVGFGGSTWPDLYGYARLVDLYNIRILTFPEDVLDAFSGVMSTLSRSFPGGFLCGLPEMFFDAVLLWQPWSPMKRRIVSRSDINSRLPSWSWVGWEGAIDSRSWRSGYSYLRKHVDEFRGDGKWHPFTWITQSTIEWYCSDSFGSARRKVVTSFQTYRGFASPKDTQQYWLPSGWIRSICETTGRAYFKNESDPNQEFWYPIPLRDLNKDIPSISNYAFLHCRTRQGVFRFGEIFMPPSSLCPAVNLLDHDGTWAGVLRLNSQYNNFGLDLNETSFDELTLIELSRGSVPDHPWEKEFFDEWNNPYCSRKIADGGRYEFYNVMWIMLDGCISYRVAVGRVIKDTWDMVATKWIDVTLG